MWRKLLLTSLVLSFAFASVFATGVDQMKAMERALLKHENGQTLSASEKALIENELAVRDASVQYGDYRIQSNGLRESMAEGFEGGTFPPAGWQTINADGDSYFFNETFQYISAPEGSFGAQAKGCNDDWLITPKVTVTAGDDTLKYQEGLESSSYPYTYDLLVSTTGTDIADFTSIGSFDGNTTDWIERVVALTAYVGQDIYIAWHVTSAASSSWDFGFDDIRGPALWVSTDPPATATSLDPADLADGVELDADLSWSVDLFTDGCDISFGTDNPPTNIEDGTDLGAVTGYTPASLAYGTTYYWSVTAYNAYGDATPTAVHSFTTRLDPTLTPPLTEDFATMQGYSGGYAPPADWSKFSAVLHDTNTVMVATTSGWILDDFGNDVALGASARNNIYGTSRKHWLVTPPIDLGDGSVAYQAEFDVALTTYSGTSATNLGVDDVAAFVISPDNGVTWVPANALVNWDETSVISNTGERVIVDLTGYTGVVKFGFYGESSVSNQDVNLYVDNFAVNEPPVIPIVALGPTEFDFGAVPVGDAPTFDVTITNNGGADLVITGTTVAAPFSSTYTGTIVPGASDVMTVTYAPTAAGTFAETLALTITGDYAGDDAVALSGSAFPAEFVLEDFEGGEFPPFGWTILDIDGSSAINPDLSYISPYSGEVAAEAMGCNDDYLITPKLLIPTGYAEFSFWHGQESVNYENSFKVMVSTTGTAPEDFVEVVDYPNMVPPSGGAWTMETVDLSAYAEQEIYVALYVYYSESSWYGFGFDDILMPPLAPNTNTLFFSEYMEGSGNNKGLEIYNLTGETANLDEYQIAQAVNGGGWTYYHAFPAGATLAHQDVWLIVTDGSFAEMQAMADEVLGYPSVVHHNGDDARALIKIVGTDTTFLDVIGDPDNDPGSGWDVAGVAVGTQNHNLVRKPEIVTGNVDWLASAGTNVDDSEWIVEDEDFWYGMGYHNEDYPLPGDACDLPIAYGLTNDPPASGYLAGGEAFWYMFTNDGSYDFVTVSLCGSTFDTKIEVWEDCDSLNYIAYNDDACGVQSEVTLDALAAGDYYVKVYGYSSFSSGDYTLTITGTNGVPDFVVSDMVYYGQDTLDVTVTNIGDGDSPGYFGTDYHGLSINGDYLGYIAEDGVALLAGESHLYQITGVGYDFLGVGMHQVAFEADVDNDVAEIDETNNADTLMIDVGYPPLAPRHVMAMAGEAQVSLTWSTAVIPPPVPGVFGITVNGVEETRAKPEVVLSDELIAKRDAARTSAFRDVGDTCGEALELTVADGSVINAPYAPYWYAYTPAADGFLTASSDGLATTDTKVYAYDACDAPYIDYDDDGGAGLQSILTIPVTGGTTYYFEWVDTWSSAAFDWALSYTDYMELADLAVSEMYIEDDAVMAVVTNIGDLNAAGVSCHWWVNGEDVAYEYTNILAPTESDTLGLYGFTWANLGAGTFNVALEVDFWGSVDELSEENNIDSIQVILEDPDYMPTYNVYRDDALLVAGLDAVNRDFDGEYIDMDVMPDVEYTYYVTQILEDMTETMPSAAVSATPWAPIFWPFPHTEDYEAIVDNMLPEGYLVEEIGEPDGAHWEVGDSAYFEGNTYNYWTVPGGTQFAGIDDDGWGSGVNGNEIMWTPWVDLSTAVDPQILFQYTVQGGNGATFLISDGMDVMAYPLTDSPDAWIGALFGLSEYVGDVIRFGFHYDDNGGWAYGMGVDNISVEEAPLPGVITGTVTDVDGNAVGYADVHAMGAFANEGTMTDAAGVYSITVPAGEYMVEVMRVNYEPVMGGVTVLEGETVTLDFTLNMHLPAPMGLMAYPSMVDTTIGLMWAPPVPMGQIAYDDGSFEGFVAPVIPSTEDNYFAAHFKAAISPGYVINEISILSTALDAESALESVSIMSSDSFGLPDFSDVLWTSAGATSATYPDAAFDFYAVGATPAEHDFWVVLKWPVGNESGPYIGHDDNTFVGNSIWANSADTLGMPQWMMDPGTFGIHAYVADPVTGRSMALHGSETVNIEKLGEPRALSVKQDITSTGSVEAPQITNISRDLLNYNVYRSLDPMAFGEPYANVAGEMFNDADFDFDTEYFYTVSAVYDEGESRTSNVDAFTYWSPLFLNHYEDFMYPDGTPLEDVGWMTDDGAGNVAANFGIEDEMLHFDWSPTATDFYQSVTSPEADFAGATAARISFYMYFDDYNDGDNGSLDFSFALSNDGFASETVIFAHNDSVYGDIDDFFIFNVADIVAGTDGWQLRLTVEGATSFTMDNLWVDDIMVESDVYGGPGEFSLLSPANDDNVVITSENVATGSLLFAWESAGDNARYAVELTGTLGSVLIPFDTTATEVLIPYSVLSAAFELAGTTGVTGSWDIVAYNEMGDSWSMNGPFNLTIGSTVGTDDTFIPDVYALYQNYPNPFNPVTTITYDIPEASDVRLVVYNLVGQPVRVLVNGFQNPSRYTLAWNGLSDAGLPVSSGIYVYRLETDSYVKTMKMMYLK